MVPINQHLAESRWAQVDSSSVSDMETLVTSTMQSKSTAFAPDIPRSRSHVECEDIGDILKFWLVILWGQKCYEIFRYSEIFYDIRLSDSSDHTVIDLTCLDMSWSICPGLDLHFRAHASEGTAKSVAPKCFLQLWRWKKVLLTYHISIHIAQFPSKLMTY